MRSGLLMKLLGINTFVIGFVICLVWLAVDYLAAGYFMTLMEKYHISPTSAHEMFLTAVHRYLLWASLAALVLAVTLSFLLMRRVLGPLTRMTEISGKIAAGDYSGTVPVRSDDEVGQLATAFNRMAEGLHAVQQLRKRMMIDVAHELRTPLSNIRGYLEAIVDGVVPPSKETFELLEQETMRLVHLVEDILRLAEADAAPATLHKNRIDLVGSISQDLDSFRPRFRAKRIKVEKHFPEREQLIRADEEKLSQVVGNLLQNALQYTPEGATVRIFMENPPGEIRVVFANPAGTLSQTDLPFIFERFYRSEKSRSREYGGAGIGLAIVKELISAHNGTVGAEIVNGEVRIWFSLPV